MLIIILTGVFVGFISSIPSGPVGVNIISTCLRKNQRSSVSIGFGAALMDTIYIFVSLTGISFIQFNETTLYYIKIVGIAVLLYLGIKEIAFKNYRREQEKMNDLKTHRYFFLGLLLYLSNPVVFFSYATIAAIIKSYHVFSDTLINNCIFSISLGLGALLWFILLSHYITRLKYKLSSSILKNISIGNGLILLVIAFYLYQHLNP